MKHFGFRQREGRAGSKGGEVRGSGSDRGRPGGAGSPERSSYDVARSGHLHLEGTAEGGNSGDRVSGSESRAMDKYLRDKGFTIKEDQPTSGSTSN